MWPITSSSPLEKRLPPLVSSGIFSHEAVVFVDDRSVSPTRRCVGGAIRSRSVVMSWYSSNLGKLGGTLQRYSGSLYPGEVDEISWSTVDARSQKKRLVKRCYGPRIAFFSF